MKKYETISKTFNSLELIFLEEALAKYNPDHLTVSQHDKLVELKADITAARRWLHQFGKSQH